MIEISPSVLTSSIEDFKRFVKNYEIFKSVDIDIIRKPFVDNETVPISEALELLKDSPIQSLGFHLMVQDPESDLKLFIDQGWGDRELRIYLQQESDINFLKNFDWPEKWRKCISLKLETDLKDLEFYEQFGEVQLMSIEIGAQGRPFDESVEDKVIELRQMGYQGLISLDGGINLKSANIVKHWDIQRVSPGSYFAKAEDVELAKMKLELALNIREIR